MKKYRLKILLDRKEVGNMISNTGPFLWSHFEEVTEEDHIADVGEKVDEVTDETILTKALEKAIENGYKFTSRLKHVPRWDRDDYFPVIFSHDFAKAFWGEERCGLRFVSEMHAEDLDEVIEIKHPEFMYLHHLQQMIIEKEPLQYLKKFL